MGDDGVSDARDVAGVALKDLLLVSTAKLMNRSLRSAYLSQNIVASE